MIGFGISLHRESEDLFEDDVVRGHLPHSVRLPPSQILMPRTRLELLLRGSKLHCISEPVRPRESFLNF